MRVSLISAALVIASIGACAPMDEPSTPTAEPSSPTGPASADPDISLDTLKTVTEQLSSDAFEGRAPGTPGEEKTVALLAESFEAAGLQPGNKIGRGSCRVRVGRDREDMGVRGTVK